MSNSANTSAIRRLEDPLDTRPTTRRRGILPPTETKAKPQNQYHLKKGDIPEDAEGFKVCIYIPLYFDLELMSMSCSGGCGDSYSHSSRCHNKCFGS